MSIDIEKLEPCPFCGDDMSSFKPEPNGLARGPGELYVICDCGAMGAGGKTVAEAVAAWNRRAAQPAPIPAQTLAPNWAGEFKSFADWVNRAQRALQSPSHLPAICVDAKGRRCTIGKDFMLARDEGAFPIRYFWDFAANSPAPCAGNALTEEAKDAASDWPARTRKTWPSRIDLIKAGKDGS